MRTALWCGTSRRCTASLLIDDIGCVVGGRPPALTLANTTPQRRLPVLRPPLHSAWAPSGELGRREAWGAKSAQQDSRRLHNQHVPHPEAMPDEEGRHLAITVTPMTHGSADVLRSVVPRSSPEHRLGFWKAKCTCDQELVFSRIKLSCPTLTLADWRNASMRRPSAV